MFMVDQRLRELWYLRNDVQSNIVPLLRGRETAFMVPYSMKKEGGNYPVRCVKAHASSYLLYNMKSFNFFSRDYNLYHSIYCLNGMPQFSFNPLKRSEEQKVFFKNYYNYVEGLDFVMDFDGDKNLPIEDRVYNAQTQALKVCGILNEFLVPYNIVFSGSKGFHIEVRGFPSTRDWNKRIKDFYQISIRLVLLANGYDPRIAEDESREAELQEILTRYSFDSSIYNVTRIWKTPFSYDVTTDMIAYPLNFDELINFRISDYTAKELMKKNHWGVGLKTRKGEIKNFWSMAKTLGVNE